MSVGTRADDDDLSPRALYMLMQQRFQDNSTAVLAALTAQKEAAQKAEESATKRFDEFKREIGEKIDSLLTSRDNGTGRQGSYRELIGYGLALSSVIAMIWMATH
jgi:hypothetical protein